MPSPSRSKIDPWPTIASAWVFCPFASARSSTSFIPQREAPVESSAPQAIRLSSMPRFTTDMSTRSQKSQIDSIGRSSRAAMIARTAPSPTRFTAERPKRILPSTTVKSDRLEFTSGGSTSRPMSAHSVT